MLSLKISLIALASLVFSCSNPTEPTKKTAYLFTYFTGNAEGEEAVHYGISRDGYNFYALNNYYYKYRKY